MSDVIDLINSPAEKHALSSTSNPSTTPGFAGRLLASASTSGKKTSSSAAAISSKQDEPKPKKAAIGKPHALLWICAAGKGQGRAWKGKALKVIGVYATKEAAENKKADIMSKHRCCGHGDILVGDSWEDEIDLVVRPVEEMVI